MSVRLRQIAVLLAAFAAVSTGAVGQSATADKPAAASPALDVLPRHPIPYKASRRSVKSRNRSRRPSSAVTASTTASVERLARRATPTKPATPASRRAD